MVTQTVIGQDQADIGTARNVLPKVYAMPRLPGACPNASPKDVGSFAIHAPLCASVIGVLLLAFFTSLLVRDRHSVQPKRLALIGRQVDLVLAPLAERYRRYKLLRIIPMVFFATIVFVGIVARWICR